MESLPDRGRSRAVLIGTSTFDHLPPLPAVRNNLEDLRTALTDPKHGVFTPENCEIVDDPRSARVFMTGLRNVVGRTDDFLLVYYAGHGLRHSTKDELYLSVRETEEDALDESAVRFERVKEVLENSPARRNLLVLDCCYSGMAVGTMSGIPVEQREIEVRGSAVLASSPRNKKSHSPVGKRHTAFTGKMISFLENGSPIAGEPLTVHSLYKRISVALVQEEFPRPLIRLTDTSGDLLVRRPAAAPARRREPPTVPRTQPAAAPARQVPPPAAAPARPHPPVGAPMPATGRLAVSGALRRHNQVPAPGGPAVQFRLRSLQVLWILTGLFVAMALGGLFGVIVDEQPAGGSASAASIMVSGVVLGAISGGSLGLLRYRWGDLGRARVPPLLTRSIGGRAVLWLGVVLSSLVAVVGVLAGRSDGDTPTTIAAAMIILAECAAACGYLLIRGQRLRRQRNQR